MGSVSVFSVPFGISTAPGEYQAHMAHEILQDNYLNGSIVYIDDTVIYGSTVDGFLRSWIKSYLGWLLLMLG